MNKFKIYEKTVKNLLLGGLLLVVFMSGCQNSSTPSSPATASSPQPPQIKSAGTGCEDNYCIWIIGNNFASNSVIELRKSNDSGQPLARYVELDRSTQGLDQLITFAVKEQDTKVAMNNPGVKVRITNPDNNLYSESESIVRQSGK